MYLNYWITFLVFVLLRTIIAYSVLKVYLMFIKIIDSPKQNIFQLYEVLKKLQSSPVKFEIQPLVEEVSFLTTLNFFYIM